MLPLIEGALVRRGWLTEAEFLDLLASAQALPGTIALNTTIFAGHHLRGLAGGLVAAFGLIWPPFLVLIGLAQVLETLRDWPIVQGFFRGILIAVAALIALSGIKLAARALKHPVPWILLGLSLLCLILGWLHPLGLLAAGALGGLGWGFWGPPPQEAGPATPPDPEDLT